MIKTNDVSQTCSQD